MKIHKENQKLGIRKKHRERIGFQLKKNIIETFLRKRVQQLLLMFCMLKKLKHILLLFQNITQIVKNKLFF